MYHFMHFPSIIHITNSITDTVAPPAQTTPAQTTAPLTNDSTTTSFEDPDSTTTTAVTDVEQDPTTEDTTTDPSSEITMVPESQSESQLLAIVLGAVGGVIALLLFAIVALLVITIQFRGKMRKLTAQILENRYINLCHSNSIHEHGGHTSDLVYYTVV